MKVFGVDWFYFILIGIASIFMSKPYLYVIQQDNYRISEIFKSKRIRKIYLVDLFSLIIFVTLWLVCYFLSAKTLWHNLLTLFLLITEIVLYFVEELPERKKPLRYTKRVIRATIFQMICVIACVSVSVAIFNANVTLAPFKHLVYFGYVLLYPLLFCTFTAFINIFERLNNHRYECKAYKTLNSRPKLIKVAITGSFGKTSVKNFLSTILSQKYNVLTTPESYNTPMGISKTLQNFDDSIEIFIAEFGARRVGDIKKLMKIVRPTHSILTSINSQHLETFKTQSNIIKEKCKILDVRDTVIVNTLLKDIVESNTSNSKNSPDIIYANTNGGDLYADNIKCDKNGCTFDIILDGERYSCFTRILGKHNVDNILLASAMAISLGVEMRYIVQGIASIMPIPHRLQLIEGNGINIIDDSFNSNPQSALVALDTLSSFEGRKIVMTPGLVELGKIEEEENKILGYNISKVADVVLLVGKRNLLSLKQGISEGEDIELHIYDTLRDAEKDFANVLKVGDNLLILNDLPDFYEE